MKTTVQHLLVILLLIPFLGYSQEGEGSIKVKMSRIVDGETKTFEGEYENDAQMKADPKYQEFVGSQNEFMFHFDDKNFKRPNGPHSNGFFFQMPGDQEPFIFQLDSMMDFDWQSFDGDMEEMKAQMEEFRKNHVFRALPPDSPGFSWFFSDSTDESKSGSVHAYGNSGQKQIHIIRNVEVKNVEGDEFGKKGSVAKNERLEVTDLSFYPNPSDGKFQLRFKVPEQGELEIKIYNVDGKEVFSRFFDQFGGTFSEYIDLSGQGKGIYLMEVRLDKNRLTKKIVIN